MKRIYLAAFAIVSLTTVLSCKKGGGDNPSPPAQKTKSVFIKVYLTPSLNASQKGYIAGSIFALLPNSGYATWKVNGTVRNGENTIGFTDADFQNGVITFESTAAVTQTSFDISGINPSNNPYNIVVVPTLNSTVTDSVSIPVSTNGTADRHFI